MTATVFTLNYANTPVTTSAYTTIVVETPIAANAIQIIDTSGQLLKIAKGNPGFEVDLFGTPLGGSIVIPYYLLKGERLSVKSLTATASTGFLFVALLKNNIG